VFRHSVYAIIEPVTQWLVRRGIHPNAISVAGFLVTLAGAWLYSQDHVRTAGACVLAGGILDIFDGRVARVSGLASKFGNFFDSTLDRISEIAMYLGLMTLYNGYGAELADIWMIYVITLALGGSLMVSYTRAKAEALGSGAAVVSAWGMLLVQSVCNFLIPSGSGQAYVTMPIMAPLADLTGVGRETSVLAYQLGDGLMNLIVPTNALLMGMLLLARIPYQRWLRFILPAIMKLYLVALAVLAVAALMRFE